MPDFTTAAVAMVGLGVGIDYALFIVTRYRENLAAGADPERSVVHALDTAGRAVLFAGTTVVISVLGLLLMKTSVMRGVAIGISIGVLTTMLASVTLLPALLGFVGRNIDKFGLPHRKRPEGEIRESGWTRWSHVIQRHPWPAAILGLLVPARAGGPAAVDAARLHRRRQPARRATPPARPTTSSPTASAPGFNGPLLLAAETPNGQADVDALNELQRQAQRHQGRRVRHAAAGQPRGRRSRCMQVFPTTDPQDEGDGRPRPPPPRRRHPVGHRRPRSR